MKKKRERWNKSNFMELHHTDNCIEKPSTIHHPTHAYLVLSMQISTTINEQN
jgi:hypothetical protein